MFITPYAFQIKSSETLSYQEFQQLKEQHRASGGFDFVYLAETRDENLYFHGYVIGARSSLDDGLSHNLKEVREYAEDILKEVESSECLAEALTSSNSWIREAAVRKIRK
jgi:hypothetical protein